MERSWYSVVLTIGRILLFIIALVFVGALVWIIVYFGLRSFSFFTNSTAGSRFSMYENGTVEWYSLSGTTVRPAAGPTGFDSSTSTPKITDAIAPLKTKDVLVLAEVKNSPRATQLGVIRNNTFLSLLTFTNNDTSFKTGVTANDDGMIVFAESTSTEATTSLDAWNLYSLSLYQVPHTFLDLGAGFGAEFSTSSAVVLAFSPKGLDRVNPAGGRTTLIPQTGITAGGAAISPDALLAVLQDPHYKTLDVFSIDPTYASYVSYIGSIHDASSKAVSFVSPTTFIVQDANNTFMMYQVANKKLASTTLSFKSS